MTLLHRWVDVEKGVYCEAREQLTIGDEGVTTERYVRTEPCTGPGDKGVHGSLTPLIVPETDGGA